MTWSCKCKRRTGKYIHLFIYLFTPQKWGTVYKKHKGIHVNKIISQSSYLTYKIISWNDIERHSAINTTLRALWQSQE